MSALVAFAALLCLIVVVGVFVCLMIILDWVADRAEQEMTHPNPNPDTQNRGK